MIAEPPSALALFFRRIMDARAARRTERARRGPVDGGKLAVEAERRALPAPMEPPAQTALSPPPRPPLPPMDMLEMPDRDHLRRVVPDYEHLEYGD